MDTKIKRLKWSEDYWLSREGSLLPWDKLEHFLLALATSSIIPHISYLHVLSGHELVILVLTALLSTFVGLWWENRDGKVPYDDAGNIQGFSIKDVVANQAGIVLGLLVNLWMFREAIWA